MQVKIAKGEAPPLPPYYQIRVYCHITLTVATYHEYVESISPADFLGSLLHIHTYTCTHTPPQSVIDSKVMVTLPLKLTVVVQCTLCVLC